MFQQIHDYQLNSEEALLIDYLRGGQPEDASRVLMRIRAEEVAPQPAHTPDELHQRQRATATLEMVTETIYDTSPTAPGRGTQERHLRSAFAVLGELVAERAVSFDLDSPDWATRFEISVLAIARVLNQHGA